MNPAALSRHRFVAASAAFTGIAILPRGLRAAEFEWKYGNDIGAEHPTTVRAVQAMAQIRSETSGRVSIKPYPNSMLGGNAAMLSQLRAGALEVLAYADGILDSLVPVASISNVAYAFKDRKTAFAAVDGDLGATVRKDISAKGLVVLDRMWETGFRNFLTSLKPIRNVDDIAGLRIRASPSKLRIDTFRSMGASPTSISSAETYTALQTHVVDGVETGLLTLDSLRWYEVQKFCSLSQHQWSGYWMLFNPEKWNALSRKDQEIVAKHFNAGALAERKDVTTQEPSVQDKIRRHGVAFNACDKPSFKAKLVANGYYSRWKNEYGAAAWAALEKYAGKLG